jgi:GLPGLI family protein
MKRILFTLIGICSLNIVLAQQPGSLPSSGKVIFEKQVNMFAVIKKYNNLNDTYTKQAFDQYKQTNAQFRVLRSILTFSEEKTLFQPLPDSGSSGFFGRHPLVEQNNIIYTDLNAQTYVCQKKVYDGTFLVSDSIRHIQWKVTSETKEIAGYLCRRANALIMDSIYVVAFYTDQLQVSGGPESFTGLPGMILGLALPHDNVAWFATSVDLTAIPAASIVAPTRGKTTNAAGITQTLGDILQNKAMLKWFLL